MASIESTEIRPFHLSIPESQIQDLYRRLDSTRWPDREPVSDWSQGAPLSQVQALCHHWRHGYDWRRCEALLNGWNQYLTQIDGVDTHFLHIKSPEENALPMLITHGWPGSVLEFRKAIGPLTDPVAHGGKAEDAFHLVVPSIPGYGLSEKPREAGWGIERVAKAWAVLMDRLGYSKWVAQGGDWGADIVAWLASDHPPPSLKGIHLNSLYFDASKEVKTGGGDPTEEEQRAIRLQKEFEDDESGYFLIQRTRPQTVGYGLADSPVACAAWIYEKLVLWTQHDRGVEEVLSKDEILDNIMLYWLPNAGTSSARMYWENLDSTDVPIDLPVGVSIAPKDHFYAPKVWGERYYRNIVHWRVLPKGGHFLAWEAPDLFVEEVRDCFRHAR